MKIKQLFSLLGIALLLMAVFGFSILKNKQRIQFQTQIQFTAPTLFLDDSIVNKLLTQKWDVESLKTKDSLDLNMLENYLETIPFVERADVYLLPSGTLGVLCTERTPLFKIASNTSSYVDRFGVKFPYVENSSLLLPVFEGMPSEEQLDEIVQLVEGLNEDGFMSKEVTQISLENNQKDYQLRLKTFDFKVILGGSDQLEEKIKKLKVFCAYQKVQDSLTGYPSINLKFKNQVVALRP